jgi:hypothetical protein
VSASASPKIESKDIPTTKSNNPQLVLGSAARFCRLCGRKEESGRIGRVFRSLPPLNLEEKAHSHRAGSTIASHSSLSKDNIRPLFGSEKIAAIMFVPLPPVGFMTGHRSHFRVNALSSERTFAPKEIN